MKKVPTDPGASILITGASSGIGKACALHLDRLGLRVFAGVRKVEDRDALVQESSGDLTPIIMDVTREDHIVEAYELVSSRSDTPLYGLINNAGISISGVMEVTPVEAFRDIIEVNVLGLHRVTQTFLPMLRRSGGRIINIGSAASFFAGPGSSSYAATKFAMRAMTDSLRIELAPFGIHVALVAPGATQSAMWGKSDTYRQKMREGLSDELKESYKLFARAADKMSGIIKPVPASDVARVVEHALLSRKPKYTYLVGPDARRSRIISMLPRGAFTKMVIKHIIDLGKE
jgi:NAD(P)-dependent dehydrogenase (short-subunit alcohol dehydrogenase family)